MTQSVSSTSNEFFHAGLLPRELALIYRPWVRRPGEMLGFWLAYSPETIAKYAQRAAANSVSVYMPLQLVQDLGAKEGARPLLFFRKDLLDAVVSRNSSA